MFKLSIFFVLVLLCAVHADEPDLDVEEGRNELFRYLSELESDCNAEMDAVFTLGNSKITTIETKVNFVRKGHMIRGDARSHREWDNTKINQTLYYNGQTLFVYDKENHICRKPEVALIENSSPESRLNIFREAIAQGHFNVSQIQDFPNGDRVIPYIIENGADQVKVKFNMLSSINDERPLSSIEFSHKNELFVIKKIQITPLGAVPDEFFHIPDICFGATPAE